VARQDTLLAAAAEVTSRCEALEKQLADAEAAAAAQAAAAAAKAAADRGAADEADGSGAAGAAQSSVSGVPASRTSGSAPRDRGAPRQVVPPSMEPELRRRLAALEAALAHARGECARLEDENGDLRAELGALDPSFFDDVDRLKATAATQGDILARYESLLRQYADALGLPFTPERTPGMI
jgi:predicted  nucleic acid-binding Zn-ribbon protein